MIRWLRDLYYAKLRRLDLEILWPQCREHAANLEQARAAFARHASSDPAWLILGVDQIDAIIWRLQ